MLSITRYRNTRYWALWEGGQLLAVTVYKKGRSLPDAAPPTRKENPTMTYPGLHPGARPIAAACFRQTRHRLAYVRQQEQLLAGLYGFRREVAARTWWAKPSASKSSTTLSWAMAVRRTARLLMSSGSRGSHDRRRYGTVSASPGEAVRTHATNDDGARDRDSLTPSHDHTLPRRA